MSQANPEEDHPWSHRFDVHTGRDQAVTFVKFNPQGNLIMSGCMNEEVILYDLVDNTPLSKHLGHRVPMVDGHFASDKLISLSEDGMIKVWDLESSHCVNSSLLPSESATASLIVGQHMLVGTKEGIEVCALDDECSHIGTIEFENQSRIVAMHEHEGRVAVVAREVDITVLHVYEVITSKDVL